MSAALTTSRTFADFAGRHLVILRPREDTKRRYTTRVIPRHIGAIFVHASKHCLLCEMVGWLNHLRRIRRVGGFQSHLAQKHDIKMNKDELKQCLVPYIRMKKVNQHLSGTSTVSPLPVRDLVNDPAESLDPATPFPTSLLDLSTSEPLASLDWTSALTLDFPTKGLESVINPLISSNSASPAGPSNAGSDYFTLVSPAQSLNVGVDFFTPSTSGSPSQDLSGQVNCFTPLASASPAGQSNLHPNCSTLLTSTPPSLYYRSFTPFIDVPRFAPNSLPTMVGPNAQHHWNAILGQPASVPDSTPFAHSFDSRSFVPSMTTVY